MIERSYEIEGVSPLVMHNARLADPLDRYTKLVAEISSKRKKTEADYVELARREWFGGLYVHNGDIVIPADNLARMIRDAATKTRLGRQVQAGLMILETDGFPLRFPQSSKSLDALWEGGEHLLRSVARVGVSRVTRTRPCFRKWSLAFSVTFDEDLLNTQQVDDFVALAGRIIGLCDWRPKHGRFSVEEMR